LLKQQSRRFDFFPNAAPSETTRWPFLRTGCVEKNCAVSLSYVRNSSGSLAMLAAILRGSVEAEGISRIAVYQPCVYFGWRVSTASTCFNRFWNGPL
jgi:hypothetical protein